VESVTGSGAKGEWYEVLGLPESATKKQVRTIYRQLALRYHPDRNKSPEALERFKKISQAYAEACAILDNEPDYAAAQEEDEWPSAQVPFPNISSADDYEPSTLVLSEGEKVLRAQLRQKGNVRCELEVSLEDVARGTRKRIIVTQRDVCGFCKGGPDKATCVHCHGTGMREEVVGVPLTIPPGIEEGMQLKLPGRAHYGGDIYVEVTIKPHQLFQRDMDNVYCEMEISTTQLRRGKKIEIPTLDGSPTFLRVPPKTRKGTIFVLQGKGLPKWGSSAKGNLMVKIV